MASRSLILLYSLFRKPPFSVLPWVSEDSSDAKDYDNLIVIITTIVARPLPNHELLQGWSRLLAQSRFRAKLDAHEQKFLPPFKESHYSRLSPSEAASPLLAPNPTSFTTPFKDLPSSRRPSQLLPPAVSSLSPNCGALEGMF